MGSPNRILPGSANRILRGSANWIPRGSANRIRAALASLVALATILLATGCASRVPALPAIGALPGADPPMGSSLRNSDATPICAVTGTKKNLHEDEPRGLGPRPSATVSASKASNEVQFALDAGRGETRCRRP